MATMSQKPLKLALLMCDTPIPTVREKYGTYLDIFRTQLKLSNPHQEFPFTLDGFDVVDAQEYPDVSNGEYAGVLISGSAYSAYESLPWIDKLTEWVANTARSHPSVRLIGICFGHQVIARALGGECVRNPGGWEVGVVDMDLTDLGREVFRTENRTMPVQQMHLDHVPSVPQGFLLLGSSPLTPVHGMLQLYSPSSLSSPPKTTSDPSPPAPSSSDILTRTHILTIQGHPEFTAPIVSHIIDARSASGKMSTHVVDTGRANAVKPHEGLGLVGRAIWRLLGVETPP